MAVSPGDILSVSCRLGFQNLDDQVNKLHVRVGTPPDPNTDTALGDDLRTWAGQFYLELAPAISNVVTAIDITIYNVSDDRPIGQFAWGGSFTGGAATGDPLPPQDTCLLLLRTGLKRRLGRIYLPSFTEPAQTAGRWTAPVTELIEDTFGYLTSPIDGPEGGVYQPVVYSPTDGLAYTIVSVRIMPIVATLKSRKLGRGS